MIKHLLWRLLQIIPILFGVLTIVFLLTRILPGDPARAMLGEYATEARVQELRETLGLSKPLHLQYLDTLQDYLNGDFGRSFRTGKPVFEEILRVFPFTLQLTLASVLLSLLIALPLGAVSAYKANTLLDTGSMFLALLGVSTPNFWVGLMLIILFSARLQWLPAVGAGQAGDLGSRLVHLILPTLTLGTSIAAVTARMTRACLMEVLSKDYVRTARAKGLLELAVFNRHILRNALIPLVTVIGLNVGKLLGGQVVIEVVFARPGVGKLLFDSILARDFPQVQASVLFFAFVFILVNLMVDLSYTVLDPKIRTV
jgi:peptide/nickel transport system permease protein